MIVLDRPMFQLFGGLDTWLVGAQYHQGDPGDRGQAVFFDRDPDNPFDPNAVAVFAHDGRQLGHLPRYDAAYFSPLIAEGAIALSSTTVPCRVCRCTKASRRLWSRARDASQPDHA